MHCIHAALLASTIVAVSACVTGPQHRTPTLHEVSQHTEISVRLGWHCGSESGELTLESSTPPLFLPACRVFISMDDKALTTWSGDSVETPRPKAWRDLPKKTPLTLALVPFPSQARRWLESYLPDPVGPPLASPSKAIQLIRTAESSIRDFERASVCQASRIGGPMAKALDALRATLDTIPGPYSTCRATAVLTRAMIASRVCSAGTYKGSIWEIWRESPRTHNDLILPAAGGVPSPATTQLRKQLRPAISACSRALEVTPGLSHVAYQRQELRILDIEEKHPHKTSPQERLFYRHGRALTLSQLAAKGARKLVFTGCKTLQARWRQSAQLKASLDATTQPETTLIATNGCAEPRIFQAAPQVAKALGLATGRGVVRINSKGEVEATDPMASPGGILRLQQARK